MKSIKIEESWLKKLLPEGFPYPSSTLISGPGGTGKPLIEFAFISSWLKHGGAAIAIPLQYPNAKIIDIALNKIYQTNLKNYHKKIAYIQLDVSIDGYEKISKNVIRANLVKPDIWNESVKEAENMIEKNSLGTLVFGSALNLLLFSKTYQDKIIKNLKNILKNDKKKTYIFSVSTTAFGNEIKELEEAADNLMYTRMKEPMKLFFKISKMKGVKFSKEEKEVPIAKKTLNEIKNIAEATRKRIIPQVMKI